jgi:hypothetical protein
MSLERYQLEAYEDLMTFEFISKGPKGEIQKIIVFSKFEKRNYYNLAFGDKIEGSNDFDDETVSNNDDYQKILATVAKAVLIFTDKNKDAWIIATGSTKSRTRLYQIAISKNLLELQTYFDIYGYKDKKWIKFEKNLAYKAFLVKRK